MLTPAHADAVAAAFGLGNGAELTGPVAAGRLGDIFRLRSSRGAYAVKTSRYAIEPASAEADAAYQDAVRSAGVPMPAVVRSVDGSVLAEIAGVLVRVYEWVDVGTPTRDLAPEAVGRLLAAIHRVKVPASGPVDEWYVEPIGERGWSDLVGRLRAAGAPYADRLAEVVPGVLATEALLAAPRQVRRCHRDLWGDNVLATPGGGLVALDWENSGPAGVDQELGYVVFEFGLGDLQRMRALVSAYEEAGGPGRLRGPGDLTMLIAQTGHIARAGCERWLAATTEADRLDNAAWVAEFLDDPVTVETVEVLLAAARG